MGKAGGSQVSLIHVKTLGLIISFTFSLDIFSFFYTALCEASIRTIRYCP